MFASKGILKIVFASTLTTLAACSGGGGGGGGTGGVTGPTAGSAGISTGTYKTGCTLNSSNSLYFINQIEVGNNSFKYTSLTYEDSGCTTLALRFVSNHGATFPGAATSPAGAQKVDITIGTITMTPTSSNAVALLNSNTECGFSNWALNTAKTVTTNVDCGAGAMTKQYSIVSVSGNTLQAGLSTVGNDGSTEAKRHNTFEAPSFTKQ